MKADWIIVVISTDSIDCDDTNVFCRLNRQVGLIYRISIIPFDWRLISIWQPMDPGSDVPRRPKIPLHLILPMTSDDDL